jgi:hypothetical protein
MEMFTLLVDKIKMIGKKAAHRTLFHEKLRLLLGYCAMYLTTFKKTIDCNRIHIQGSRLLPLERDAPRATIFARGRIAACLLEQITYEARTVIRSESLHATARFAVRGTTASLSFALTSR